MRFQNTGRHLKYDWLFNSGRQNKFRRKMLVPVLTYVICKKDSEQLPTVFSSKDGDRV